MPFGSISLPVRAESAGVTLFHINFQGSVSHRLDDLIMFSVLVSLNHDFVHHCAVFYAQSVRLSRFAGLRQHTMKKDKKEITVSICVGYRRYRDRKTGKQKTKNCFSPHGVCVVLPPKFANVIANASASKPAIAKCGRHAYIPALEVLACGCFLWQSR